MFLIQIYNALTDALSPKFEARGDEAEPRISDRLRLCGTLRMTQFTVHGIDMPRRVGREVPVKRRGTKWKASAEREATEIDKRPPLSVLRGRVLYGHEFGKTSARTKRSFLAAD